MKEKRWVFAAFLLMVCAGSSFLSGEEEGPRGHSFAWVPGVLGARGERREAETKAMSEKGSSTPTDIPREITNSLGMKLVLIPAGEFVMGGRRGGGLRTSDPRIGSR